MSTELAPGLIANINELFDARHQLATTLVETDEHALPPRRVFVEEVGTDGRRAFVDLTAKAEAANDARREKPLRGKGSESIRDLPRFLEAIQNADEDLNPVVEIAIDVPTHPGSTVAKARLNATRPDGKLGHNDWSLSLLPAPDPVSQLWINALEKEMPFTAFADLVYKGGGAVVPSPSQPAHIASLGKLLKLDVAADLGALLALCNGLDTTGKTEETVIVDANTGDVRTLMAKENKASVAVPTGIVLAWEPLPNFSAPYLVRLTRRIEGGVAFFTLKPVNLPSVQRALALEIHGYISDALSGHDAPVQLV